MKELEFYKSNYEDELKDILNYWFNLARLAQMKDNDSIDDQIRKNIIKEYSNKTRTDILSKYQMNTIKYGGIETARILAMIKSKKITENKNKCTTVYVWSAILATLKKEILGQEIDPLDIIRIIVSDYDEREKDILDAKEECIKLYKEGYGENPYWK